MKHLHKRHMRGALNNQEWQAIWAEFNEKFDSQNFYPRNTVQQNWIARLVNAKIQSLLEQDKGN